VRVLGVETSTSVCAAAVTEDGDVLVEVMLDEHYVHAEKLLTMIDRALSSSGTSLDRLDGVAVSVGPGSFTGLRIGLSVAKGIVYATGKPLLAVPTLEALAHRALAVSGSDVREYVLAVLDARRDDVYAQLFARRGDRPLPLGDVRACMLSEVVTDVGSRQVLVTGDAVPKLRSYLLSLPSEVQEQFRLLDAHRARCSAGSVALCGEGLLAANRVEDPAALEPRYIKEFFFKTHKHDKGT
jgi:tRNA threonylcarbamoyladenosine biosynthesis protein TsaB